MYNALYYAACIMIFCGSLIAFVLGVIASIAAFYKWGVDKGLWNEDIR